MAEKKKKTERKVKKKEKIVETIKLKEKRNKYGNRSKNRTADSGNRMGRSREEFAENKDNNRQEKVWKDCYDCEWI